MARKEPGVITEHQSGGKTVWVDLFNPSDREIGEACARMPMPAVMLMNNMPHKRKNCGVRMA